MAIFLIVHWTANWVRTGDTIILGLGLNRQTDGRISEVSDQIWWNRAPTAADVLFCPISSRRRQSVLHWVGRRRQTISLLPIAQRGEKLILFKISKLNSLFKSLLQIIHLLHVVAIVVAVIVASASTDSNLPCDDSMLPPREYFGITKLMIKVKESFLLQFCWSPFEFL